jgi:transposase
MTHPTISINLSFEQLFDVVKKLQPTEKLLLNEALWDEAALIPSEHQTIVMERMGKAKQHRERLIDWDKASQNL